MGFADTAAKATKYEDRQDAADFPGTSKSCATTTIRNFSSETVTRIPAALVSTAMDPSNDRLFETVIHEMVARSPGIEQEIGPLAAAIVQEMEAVSDSDDLAPKSSRRRRYAKETAQKGARRRRPYEDALAHYREAFLIQMHQSPGVAQRPDEVHAALLAGGDRYALLLRRRKGFNPSEAAAYLEGQGRLTLAGRGKFKVDVPYRIPVPSVEAYQQELCRVLRHILRAALAAFKETDGQPYRENFEAHMSGVLAGQRDPQSYPRPDARLAMFTVKLTRDSWPTFYEQVLEALRAVITRAEMEQEGRPDRQDFGLALAVHKREDGIRNG